MSSFDLMSLYPQRPFAEYDSNYQIMFVVGMGRTPRVPDTLSAEGQQFCRACLTHEPDQRPRAEELSLHHFLMVRTLSFTYRAVFYNDQRPPRTTQW